MTPKQQLIKNRRLVLKDMTVEKAEKYPDLYSNLFEQADTMYKFDVMNERLLAQGI